MGYEAARKSIQGFFSDNFTGVAATKIAWDNVEFRVPTDASSWVRFSLQHNISNYVSLGRNRLTRRRGLVFVQVFVPENSETLIASQIVDDVVDVFETNALSGVVFESPNVREIGTNGGWFQINISVPFYYDDVTTVN